MIKKVKQLVEEHPYILCLILIAIINGIYFCKFNGGLSEEQIDFSYYGTYIGGTVGIVLTFITIIILIKTLHDQRENSKFIKVTTEKQIEQTKEYHDKSEIYQYIKDKITKIEEIAYSKIDYDDTYYFIHNNSEFKIRKFISKNTDYDKLMKLDLNEYKQKQIGNESNIVINFLHTIKIINHDYNSFVIPYNIKYKVENLRNHITNLAFLISQYLMYDNSITMINILLYEVQGVIDILHQLDLFKNNEINTYEFFKELKDDPTVKKSVSKPSSNFREVKELVYNKLLNLNIIDNLGLNTFISMYTILSNSDNILIVKDVYNKEVYRGVIMITPKGELYVESVEKINNDKNNIIGDAEKALMRIFNKFDKCSNELIDKYSIKHNFNVYEDYNIQDLLRVLLNLYFDDIKTLKYTPSYSVSLDRVDFLLKNENIVIEVIRSEKSFTARKLKNQLKEDIARYKSHPNCKKLFCFVYDPNGYISNPRGIEKDLSKEKELPTKVVIRPKF